MCDRHGRVCAGGVSEDPEAAEGERLLLAGSFDLAAAALDLACTREHARGLLLRGYMHKFGLGGEIECARAFDLMQRSGASGYAPALCAMATSLHQGKGVERNADAAAELVTRSFFATREQALRGDDWLAQFILGYTYSCGIAHVSANHALAAECYAGAAQHGFVVSIYNLGVVYENGNGVAADVSRAIELYSEAARMGYRLARCALGTMYELGRGVAPDSRRALALYKEAAEQGSPEAQTYIGTIYYEGNDIIEEDKQEALKWFTKAAARGNSLAQNKIAIMYYYGKGGLELSYPTAVEYFRMAAESGNKYGQYNLGMCYENGQGVDRPDLGMAMEWYQRSAAQGYGEALHTLGLAHLTERRGVDRNVDKAIALLERAGNAGHVESLEILAGAYDGKFHLGFQPDDERRVHFLRKAALLQSADSIGELAEMHERSGGPVPYDPEEARRWWKRLAGLDEHREKATQRVHMLFARYALVWSPRRHTKFPREFQEMVRAVMAVAAVAAAACESSNALPIGWIPNELVHAIIRQLANSLFADSSHVPLTDSEQRLCAEVEEAEIARD